MSAVVVPLPAVAITIAVLLLSGTASAQVFECSHAPAWRCDDRGCRPTNEAGPPVLGRNAVTRYDLRRQTAALCQDVEDGTYSAHPPRRGQVHRHCGNSRIGAVRSEREPIRNMPSFVLDDASAGVRTVTVIYQWEAGWRFTKTVTLSRAVETVAGSCRQTGE